MPECRGCGVALDWHEHELCASCWEARETDDDDDPGGAFSGESPRISGPEVTS